MIGEIMFSGTDQFAVSCFKISPISLSMQIDCSLISGGM